MSTKNQGGAMAALRDGVVRASLLLSLLAPALFAYAALGTRFGLHDWGFGLRTLTIGVGPIYLIAAAGIALLALGAALLVPPRKGAIAAVVALLVPVLGLGTLAALRQTAGEAPPIHDISTDLADPPRFSQTVEAARGLDANPLELADKRVPNAPLFGAAAGRFSADLQREAYPDIAPLPVGIDPQEAFDIALQTAEGLGWTIGGVDRAAGRIEASVRSFWFGFVDDVAIRVRARPEGGAIVDLRSVSRVGVSDLGANAERVRAFSAGFTARLRDDR